MLELLAIINKDANLRSVATILPRFGLAKTALRMMRSCIVNYIVDTKNHSHTDVIQQTGAAQPDPSFSLHARTAIARTAGLSVSRTSRLIARQEAKGKTRPFLAFLDPVLQRKLQ